MDLYELTHDQREIVIMADLLMSFIVKMETMQKSPRDGGGPLPELDALRKYLTDCTVMDGYAPAVQAFMDNLQVVIDQPD